MKCYHCGKKMSDGTRYCVHCGKAQRVTCEMIRAARSGDQEAYTDLYECTMGAVRGTVRKIIKDSDIAMDIVQDSYMQAFQKMDTLQDPQKFCAWVCAIAHNLAVNWLRKKREITFTELAGPDGDFSFEAEDEDARRMPEYCAEQEEISGILCRMLTELPEEQQIVMILYCRDQYTEREIAEILKIPVNTVKSRKAYAQRKLRRQAGMLEGFAPQTSRGHVPCGAAAA